MADWAKKDVFNRLFHKNGFLNVFRQKWTYIFSRWNQILADFGTTWNRFKPKSNQSWSELVRISIRNASKKRFPNRWKTRPKNEVGKHRRETPKGWIYTNSHQILNCLYWFCHELEGKAMLQAEEKFFLLLYMSIRVLGWHLVDKAHPQVSRSKVKERKV